MILQKSENILDRIGHKPKFFSGFFFSDLLPLVINVRMRVQPGFHIVVTILNLTSLWKPPVSLILDPGGLVFPDIPGTKRVNEGLDAEDMIDKLSNPFFSPPSHVTTNPGTVIRHLIHHATIGGTEENVIFKEIIVCQGMNHHRQIVSQSITSQTVNITRISVVGQKPIGEKIMIVVRKSNIDSFPLLFQPFHRLYDIYGCTCELKEITEFNLHAIFIYSF